MVRALLKVHDVPSKFSTTLGRAELPGTRLDLKYGIEWDLMPMEYFRICHVIGLHQRCNQKTMTCCDDMRANRGLDAVMATDSAGLHILAIIPHRDLSKRVLRVPLHYCPWCGKTLGFSGTPLLTKADTDTYSHLFDKDIEDAKDGAYDEGYDEGYEDGKRDR